jgi:hypothetical protein
VSPENDQVLIDGTPVGRGSRVRMLPGIGSTGPGGRPPETPRGTGPGGRPPGIPRGTDAQDLFLVGREATVQAVFHDVDGNVHVAVSPDHDPAADLQRSHGRYLYFRPDELEPLSSARPQESAGKEDPA